LFHDISPEAECESVVVDSSFEAIPENAPDIVIEEKTYDLPCYQEHITDTDIETIERITRGQNNNETWRELKRIKLTASNFNTAARRQNC